MSFQNPANRISRWSVQGMEGMWAKMFDPPKDSPVTPDQLAPTNPAPEVMALAGMQRTPTTPHTLEPDLMHGINIPTWDNRPGGMNFFLIRDGDNPTAVGTFPGPTIRVPRGSVFHSHTQGHGPPPHTIHWHGLEPTPINDGVGHCSMEIGDYTYQFQPNFVGSYFYHCHRNTVQHFEFGLYGFFVVEPPDVYFASLQPDGTLNPSIPIGRCRDGKRRTAANMSAFPEFPGFNSNPLTAPDPWTGDPRLKFLTDPHAMTIEYDVEALWVVDDRDATWSDLASDARVTYPAYGINPGVDDNFNRNPGTDGFFAFNDFNPDYFYVTGLPVPARRSDLGGTGEGTIPTGTNIPAELNSGVAGTQVAIDAAVDQTILVRALCAAYACAEWTFPVDVVIIAWDGRALGVPPYGEYNHAYRIPAGTPFRTSVARRFDALIRSTVEVHDFAVVKFIDTRGEQGGLNNLSFDVLPTAATPHGSTIQPGERVLMTAKIPVDIGPAGPGTITPHVSGSVVDEAGAPVAGVLVSVEPMSLGGTKPPPVQTDALGRFTVPDLVNGMYEVTPSLEGKAFAPTFQRVTLNDLDVVLPAFVAGPGPTYEAGSYTKEEALRALKGANGEVTLSPSELARFDVGPIVEGMATPDGKVDIKDVVTILRMASGSSL